MDNEFQWRSGLRRMNEPVMPANDLWPAIHTRLNVRRRWRRHGGLALAASLVIASTVFVVFPKVMQETTGHGERGQAAARTVPASPPKHTPLDWAVPADPTLAAAAHSLDHASAQLQFALEQRPDAVFLVSLINRTNAQRMRLLRKPYAG